MAAGRGMAAAIPGNAGDVDYQTRCGGIVALKPAAARFGVR